MLLPVIPRKLILRVTYHSTYCLEHFKPSKMKLYQIIVEYNTPQTRCILFSGSSGVYPKAILGSYFSCNEIKRTSKASVAPEMN